MPSNIDVKDFAPYVSPLKGYVADAKRDGFLEGARWALEELGRRQRTGEAMTDAEVRTAARAYAGLPVE